MSSGQNSFDAVIIGAGPAGIAAAVTIGEAGGSVALVDDNPHAGGQIWRNRGTDTAPPAARDWLRRLASCERIQRLQQTHVVACVAEGKLLVENPKGTQHLVYRSLVLATGARERFIPFPGWTLPGVFGAGALQALIKSGMEVGGKTVVVAGTGPLLLAVADLLRAKGAHIPLILEQASSASIYRFGFSLWRDPAKLVQAAGLKARNLRTRYATGCYPLRVAANGEYLLLTYFDKGRERQLQCDLIGCGFDLLPNTELPRAMGCDLNADGFVSVNEHRQTSQSGVYAVGEITGIGGVEKALVEGQIAGRSVMGRPRDGLGASLARAQRFAEWLKTAFAIRDEVYSITTPESIVCRCEDVTLDQILRCHDPRDAKLQTRCGMGPCQGRVCGPTLERRFGVAASRSRPPIVTSSVGALAQIGTRSDTPRQAEQTH